MTLFKVFMLCALEAIIVFMLRELKAIIIFMLCAVHVYQCHLHLSSYSLQSLDQWTGLEWIGMTFFLQ